MRHECLRARTLAGAARHQRMDVGGLAAPRRSKATSVGDLIEWQAAWSRSLLTDPLWHSRWTLDVQRKSVRVLSTLLRAQADPRAVGLVDQL